MEHFDAKPGSPNPNSSNEVINYLVLDTLTDKLRNLTFCDSTDSQIATVTLERSCTKFYSVIEMGVQQP